MKGKKFQETEVTNILELQRIYQELESSLKRNVSKEQLFPDVNLRGGVSWVKCLLQCVGSARTACSGLCLGSAE